MRNRGRGRPPGTQVPDVLLVALYGRSEPWQAVAEYVGVSLRTLEGWRQGRPVSERGMQKLKEYVKMKP